MKFLRVFLLLFSLFFVACTSDKKQEVVEDSLYENDSLNLPVLDTAAVSYADEDQSKVNPNSILITCEAVGKINMNDSYQDVIRKAGKNFVSQDSVFVKGVFQNAFVTKVWKGTAGEITINWQETKQPYQTIQNIIIDHINSTYVLENGVKIGSKMSLLNKLNGKPFSLIGFKGNDGGTVINFNEGNLNIQMPCFRAVFQLPNAKKEVLTTGLINSNHAVFKTYDPVLTKLIINAAK